MKVEDYPITIGETTKSGYILRVTDEMGVIGFFRRPPYPYSSLYENPYNLLIVLKRLKEEARFILDSYEHNSPEKVKAQVNFEFWAKAVEQERQKHKGDSNEQKSL